MENGFAGRIPSLPRTHASCRNHTERSVKGGSVGTRALFQMLNNKPLQVSKISLLGLLTWCRLVTPRCQPRKSLAFLCVGGQVNFVGVSRRGCHEQTLTALINPFISNGGLSLLRSVMDGFSLCWRCTSMIVPIMGAEWLLTRESFPAPFVSLAVKGSKLETEIMEGLAFWLSVS